MYIKKYFEWDIIYTKEAQRIRRTWALQSQQILFLNSV